MDTVALASVITSGAVGIGSIGGLVWTTRYSARLAREDRSQRRLGEAYVELLGMVEREGSWLEYRCAKLLAESDELWAGIGGPALVPKPEPIDRARVVALLGAYASRTVQVRYREWLSAVTAVEQEHERLEWNWREDGDPNAGIDWGSLRPLDETIQPAERTARQALADAVASELGHR